MRLETTDIRLAKKTSASKTYIVNIGKVVIIHEEISSPTRINESTTKLACINKTTKDYFVNNDPASYLVVIAFSKQTESE